LAGNHLIELIHLPLTTLYWAACIGIIESLRALSIGYYRTTEQYEKIGRYFISVDVLEVLALGFIALRAGSASLAIVIWLYIGIRSVSAFLSLLDIRPLLTGVTRAEIRQRLQFGAPLVPKDVVLWLGHSADRFIVSYFLGPSITGIYAAAYKLASIVKLVSQPVTFVTFPRLVELWDNAPRADFRQLLRKSVAAYLGLVVPVLVIFALFAEPVLGLVSSELRGQGWIVMWVAAGMLFHTLQGISSYYVYVFVGRVFEYTAWIGGCFGVGVLLQFVLIRRFGLDGAAVASFMTYFIFWMVITRQSNRLLQEHSNERQ
jgi:O-antigen/teichoic acid export membrane protein